MHKQKVLFVCIHNSARSQMAEALLRRLAGDRFEVESAGLDPGNVNPLAVEALGDLGIDISAKKTQSVFDLYKQGRVFQYVIAVCDEASERCPIFPSAIKRLSWSFPDPSRVEGSYNERLDKTKAIRDEIAEKIQHWLMELPPSETIKPVAGK